MSAWLPHPVWSAVLAATWLSLNGTLSAGHVILGALLGVAIPYALRGVWPRPAHRSSRPGRAFVLALGFAALLAWDVVVANLQVARAVLSPVRRLRPGFAIVPVELDDPRAIAIFAHAITLTPGTVSVDLSPDRRQLTIHALDMPDPAATVVALKARYERRLREIFA
jgi:multicomponent K+:H+ antiporter subunit E